MTPVRVRLRLVAAAVVLALTAGCWGWSAPRPPNTSAPLGTPSAPSSGPAVTLNEPFTNWDLEIVVTRVQTGVTQLPVDGPGIQPYKTEIGQFILVHLSAKNVGDQPASVSATSSTLIDDQGKEYASSHAMSYQHTGGQGLDTILQPGISATGYLIFDLPTWVKPAAVRVQPDATVRTTNPPTVVKLV